MRGMDITKNKQAEITKNTEKKVYFLKPKKERKQT